MILKEILPYPILSCTQTARFPVKFPCNAFQKIPLFFCMRVVPLTAHVEITQSQARYVFLANWESVSVFQRYQKPQPLATREREEK